MNPNKIQKMNEEVQKWSRKDPMAIKKGMAVPGNYKNLVQELVPDRATWNLNARRVLTLKTQTRLNLRSKKPKKLILLEPKLEIL